MAEVRFYALQRRALAEALAEQLEVVLASGEKAFVQVGQAERVDALDQALWTFQDESFLPHGVSGGADAARQPVLVGAGEANGNAATVRAFVDGADPSAAFAAPAGYLRLIVMFDDRDDDSKAAARKHWAVAKATGHALSFWREGDEGGWRKVG